MEKEVLNEPTYIEEIVNIIRSGLPDKEIAERLEDYHDNDIAESLSFLTKEERVNLYNILGAEWISEIISFLDDPENYISEIGIDKLAAVINEMDSDDAVDLLEEIDEKTWQAFLRKIIRRSISRSSVARTRRFVPVCSMESWIWLEMPPSCGKY